MSNIDDRLRALLGDDNLINSYAVGTQPLDEAITQIKQAFADEGYVKGSSSYLTGLQIIKDQNLMTGQEWYDRFKLEKLGVILETGTQNITRRLVFAAWDKADEAAKRAAGLSHD